jgi:hypothetical protein
VGCVARSGYVDRLAEAQSETAATVANLADSYAKLAREVASIQAPRAEKIANAAEMQAANALDLSDEKSGVDVSGMANKAMTGDWAGLLGLAVTTALGAGYGYQQKRKATLNRRLAEEVADLDPCDARERLKKA